MKITLEDVSALALAHASGQETEAAVPGLTIWFSPCSTVPMPAMFEASIYLVLNGAKRMSMGGKSFNFLPGSLSVSAVGGAFTGQVVKASVGAPYVAVKLKLNVGLIASLLLETLDTSQSSMKAATVIQATDDMIEPVYRLLRLLFAPTDIPVLAPLIERELYYRLLQSGVGDAMRQTVQVHTRFAQIKRAVEWICDNATIAMSVDALAATVDMSVTSFHRHFKAVTGLSPLAYQRHVRLLHAQRLLNVETSSVTAVAFEVGYASSSQFSREYARMFGVPPVRDTFRSRQTERGQALKV
jgi:AraC-like DNA-binding protein